VLATLDYQNQTPQEFMEQINKQLHSSALQEHKRQVKLMGSAFEFIVVAPGNAAEKLLDESVQEVQRLENLLTEFSSHSQTALINQNAGIQAVETEAEVFALIKRCKELSSLTGG